MRDTKMNTHFTERIKSETDKKDLFKLILLQFSLL